MGVPRQFEVGFAARSEGKEGAPATSIVAVILKWRKVKTRRNGSICASPSTSKWANRVWSF